VIESNDLIERWTNVERVLTGKFAASALLLEQYFVHSGDWKKMERELVADAPIDPALVERVVHIISSGLAHAATKI